MSKVRLYGFEDCPYCQELKDLYDENGVVYDYIDIEVEKYKEEVSKIMVIAKTESVPIVMVNKVVLSPEISFKSIRDAYLLTNKFLSQ
jgi:glutaredoxin